MNPVSRTFAALAALTLGVAACGGGEGGKVATRYTTSTSSTVTTAPGGGGGTVDAGRSSDGGGDAAGGQGSSGGPTAGTQSPPPPAPTAPDAARPMKPGTYEYDTVGQVTQSGPLGGTDQLPPLTTLKADPPDGGRQQSVRDMRDADGNGGFTTTILQYRDDGVYLESAKSQNRVSGVTITYEFRPDPPQLIAPTGAGVGYHTAFAITSTNGGIRTDTTLDVLAEETLTVGGTSLRTFKVRTHTVLSGDAEGDVTSNDNVDPEHYLVVREDSVSDVKSAFGDFHTEQVSTLRSLDPK